MNRRQFIKTISALPMFATIPASAMRVNAKNNYLIMLELKGGNDSLNTFIPFNDEAYYSQRPSIAIPRGQSISITENMAFHPALENLASLYRDEEMSIFHNVGYPNPNKSHFTSLAIVEKGVSGSNGWAYEAMNTHNRDLDGIVFSGSDGLFDADTPNFIKMKNIKKFVKQSKALRVNRSSNPQARKYNHTKKLIKQSAAILQRGPMGINTYTPSNPESKLAQQFVQIAKVIKSNVNMPILKLHLSGFDTHADQVSAQGDLLKELDVSINDFSKYLKSQNLWDNSLIYAFSEFGRRVAENGNGGTDHGEAYAGFAIGGKVVGGSYGDLPSLSQKNVRYEIDHRQLLHTLETKWLNRGYPTSVVKSFSKVDFIKHAYS